MRRLALEIAVFVLALAAGLSGLLGADLYEHQKHAESVPNVNGYRGPLVGAKAADELRLAVVGGSLAFGYGVAPRDALPAQLADLLKSRLSRPLSVVNLAANGDSSVCFAATLDDYAYLQPDAVLIYSGDNDVLPNAYQRDPASCMRERSPVFRLLGYLPVLPDLVQEAYFRTRYSPAELLHLEINAITVPRVSPAGPQGAPPVEARSGPVAARSASSLPPLGTAAPVPPKVQCDLNAPIETDANIDAYVATISGLAQKQIGMGRTVIVAVEPYLNDYHCRQQAALKASLAPLTASQRLWFVDTATDPNLHDPAIAWDGEHFTEKGNQLVAAALAGPVAQALQATALGPPDGDAPAAPLAALLKGMADAV